MAQNMTRSQILDTLCAIPSDHRTAEDNGKTWTLDLVAAANAVQAGIVDLDEVVATDGPWWVAA